MSSNSNWGGPRPGSGRPLNPLTPLQAMERATELVSKTIKVLGSTAMKDDDTLDLPEGAKYCMMDLMSVADKLEEAIEREKAIMKSNTLEVVQLSEEAPRSPQGPQSWGGSQDGSEMVTYQQPDGWYGYLQGVKDGNFSEGDDQGPFSSREEAEQELRSQYEEMQKPVENIYPDDL